ncbi:hypothetical protein ARHIZOSPH14_10750 [Agromyces rhizosphaerae]|uniref:M23ase beta-sheet core domain-containing protein n=1 Tax=Agromyces rhizosphaerae TaxID=88374 RepID=A0A9W6CQT8_9MICO|nr:peptidoglycan DD-metalloendopeptidase family protein [Agromyces rhizosphaerae]GLI26833.1 hypothetical protein ARHIZOSPH14_10750 [Agromyces rhizosphaerae]
MPEFPLVPDGPETGTTHAASRERPLTRRELREQQRRQEEAAEAAAYDYGTPSLDPSRSAAGSDTPVIRSTGQGWSLGGDADPVEQAPSWQPAAPQAPAYRAPEPQAPAYRAPEPRAPEYRAPEARPAAPRIPDFHVPAPAPAPAEAPLRRRRDARPRASEFESFEVEAVETEPPAPAAPAPDLSSWLQPEAQDVRPPSSRRSRRLEDEATSAPARAQAPERQAAPERRDLPAQPDAEQDLFGLRVEEAHNSAGHGSVGGTNADGAAPEAAAPGASLFGDLVFDAPETVERDERPAARGGLFSRLLGRGAGDARERSASPRRRGEARDTHDADADADRQDLAADLFGFGFEDEAVDDDRRDDAMAAEPAFDADRTFDAAPALDAEPVFLAEPAIDAEPAFEAEPAFDAAPAVDATSAPASDLDAAFGFGGAFAAADDEPELHDADVRDRDDDLHGPSALGSLFGFDEPEPAHTRTAPPGSGFAIDSTVASTRSSGRDRASSSSTARMRSADHPGLRTDSVRSAGTARPAARTHPKAKPSRDARRAARRRAAAAKGLSLVAMGFVAMITVATSLPANSLLSAEEVQAAQVAVLHENGLEPQVMHAYAGGDDSTEFTVDTENYQVATIAEYAAASGIRVDNTFTNNPYGTIQWPFPVGVHIGSYYGYRSCAGCTTNHHGIDFNPGYGAEIQAIADGVVSVAQNGGGSLGVVMMIDHVIDGQVVTSVYAHMQYDSMRFQVGDTVEVGDIVGNVGSTGLSTGPHLHFEIRIGGVEGYWVDPLAWLYENTD